MPSRQRTPWIVAFVAFALPIGFALYTNHVWEDYLITLRSSRNLVEGNGLVFTPGERLHTFTSPLGVLVPALFTWISGGHETAALWLFRLFSACLIALAATFAWKRLQSLGVGALGAVTALGLIVADSRLVDFATNGMETAILLLFVLLLWTELERTPGPRSTILAVACAGLMWTRPDGFILATALIVPHLVLHDRQPAAPVLWGRLARGIAFAIALYLPWLAFTTWYYGTPIPHTIIAKGAISPPIHLRSFLLIPWHSLTGESTLIDLFLPTYWFYGNWPRALTGFAHVFVLIAAFAWVFPFVPRFIRRLSLTVFLGMFYVCSIILFPWYSPPWSALAALVVGGAIDATAKWASASGRAWLVSSLRIGAALALAIQLGVLLAASWEMRVQQRLVENTVRRPIGEWLRAHADPHDTVFLEPLGYIGYYSQLKMYDYPGLSSREVAGVIRSGHRRLTEVIAALKPTWIVVRPWEIADASAPQNAAWRDYALVKTWSVRAQLDAIRILPGRGWLEHDAEFRVFRRLPVPPSLADNPSAPPPRP